MIAPLGALVFFATLWLLVVVGAAMLEESGAKIALALNGKPAHRSTIGLPAARVRINARTEQPSRERPRLRAAA